MKGGVRRVGGFGKRESKEIEKDDLDGIGRVFFVAGFGEVGVVFFFWVLGLFFLFIVFL